MPLLDGLSEVDWSRLHHAYGPATDVPELLRALVDPNQATEQLKSEAQRDRRTIVQQVEWNLWGNVFHQGTRWQVTAHVVPFLVEILVAGPQHQDLRCFLLSYLHHLAIGYPEDDFPERFDPDSAFRQLEGQVAPDGEPDYSDDVAPDLWTRDSYLAVEAAIERIAPLMGAADTSVAMEAIALIASFPRCKSSTLPILRDQLQKRSDQAAAHALVSLAQLTGVEALSAAESLVDSEHRAVAIVAACAAVLADPDRASAAAIGVLTGTLGESAGLRSAHARTLTELVAKCLARVSETHRERAIDAVAAQHRQASPMERLSLTSALLGLAFGEGRVPTSASALSAPQRRALAAIRDYGAFEVGGAIFANYCGLVREAGLPDSAAALGLWLNSADSLQPTPATAYLIAPTRARRPWRRFWR